jgi:hypothetical protein
MRLAFVDPFAFGVLRRVGLEITEWGSRLRHRLIYKTIFLVLEKLSKNG